jgi:O-antigen ligase
MAVIFFLAANNLKDKHSMKTAITALIIFTCITGMGGIFEHYFRVGFFQNENSKAYKYLAEPLHRCVGPFHHPVVFGMYLMMVIPLILPRLNAFNEIKSRWLSIIALLITTMGLIYTYSRGCWIAVLVAILFYGIMNIKPKKLLSWSFAGLIFLLLTVELFPKAGVSVRIKSILDLKYNNSNISRMSGWKTSIKMMKEYPVFGVGWSRAGVENSRYIESNEKSFNHAHNMFINFAVETGVIGFGVLIWFFTVLFKSGLHIIKKTKDKSLKQVACSIMAALVAFIVSGMVDYPFNLPVIVSLFYFLTGILFAIPEMERRQHG